MGKKSPRLSNSPTPCFTEAIGDSLTEDFEFRRLFSIEWEALRANKGKLRFLLKDLYVAMGGNLQNAKSMFLILVNRYVTKKLDKLDLPGPDAMWRPQILSIAQKLAEEAFDEFFTST